MSEQTHEDHMCEMLKNALTVLRGTDAGEHIVEHSKFVLSATIEYLRQVLSDSDAANE